MFVDPSADPRNLIDEFKGMEASDVKDVVLSRTKPFAVAMVNWEGDFNFSSMVRSANAFGARKVFYVGRKRKWDRRGAQGTYHYTTVEFCESVEALFEKFSEEGFNPVAVEQSESSVDIRNASFPELPVLVFGSESSGLDESVVKDCQLCVEIPQFGSTRSINAACAASVAMYALHASVFA